MTYLVARTCTEIVNVSGERISRSLGDLRSRVAYVLLGDPGSGKTQSFKAEAAACNGLYVSARDFLTLTFPTSARGKPIFIDGLDESRAGEGDGRTPLDRIRQRLDALDRPHFRLSCREADWLGASDRHALAAVALAGEVSVLHLDQLTRDQVRDILAHHPSINDPDEFLKHAEDRGLGALLHNPQTLSLLVEAVKGNAWPSTRQETFQLACEKLAAELNEEHRSATRGKVPDTSSLLHAAGGLCAILLLADVSGFTETGEGKAGIVALRDIACFRNLPLAHALKTRLFVGIGEEKFTPVHRSVAEYLAARFLTQVIQNGLSIGRVVSLMTAADGGTVAGLRGLNAWLSVHHPPSRRRLIEIDPLGSVLYGDTRLFSVEDKVALLAALHGLARQYAGFRWQDWSAKPFGALATADMVEHLRSILSSPSREESHQAFLDCVLDAVRYGDPLPQLRDELRDAVMDATRWPAIRSDALTAYMHVSGSDTEELRRIAEDIRDGRIEDPEDEMLGRLLHKLFPHTIKAEDVYSYMHRPKNNHLIGTYYTFWSRGISESAKYSDIPILLDALVAKKPAVLENHTDLKMRDMVGNLLKRGVRDHGESVTDERLYRWLGAAVDKHGFPWIDQDGNTAIGTWLEAHPERYKGLLSVAIAACAGDNNFRWCVGRGSARFFNAKAPDDLGLWWLSHSESEPDQEKADVLFYEAVGQFFREQAAAGLSLDYFEKWVEARPRFAPAYQRAIYQEIPDWRREHAEHDRQHKEEQQKRRDEWMQYFRWHLPKIRSGEAHLNVFDDLARAYFGQLIEAHGETELERLSNFLDGDADLISAALSGFRLSLLRPDLPSVHQILELDTRGRGHVIRQACLAGIAELYREDPSRVLGLSDEVLSKAVAFRYTNLSNDQDWFKALVRSRPAIVANVLVEHVTMLLNAKKDHIGGIYPLAHDEEYADVARLAVMPLLRAYPSRARKKQGSGVLGDLLKTALLYLGDDDIKTIVNEKLAIPKMDATQRVYWFAAGFAIAPGNYEGALSAFIGKSNARVKILASFFSDRLDRRIIRDGMPASSLAYLIRMFGPICSPERPRGTHWVSPAMHTAEFVQALVNRLGGMASAAAEEQIKRLLDDSTHSAWHSTLRHALHTQRVSYREATFGHPTVSQTCETLENRGPANAADLAALVGEHLRELASEIRNSNTDQYKQFWNVDGHSRPTNARPEDACRDTLLERLKDRLRPLGIDAVPEGHYADDKRTDVRVSHTTPKLSMAIPIEIKRDSHPDLWTAMSDQLIDLYTRDPESKGRGIFLVFWFGGAGMPAPPTGDKPTSAADLEARLLAIRPADKREFISVCIVDCSLSRNK
jgi:hypothetical protein